MALRFMFLAPRLRECHTINNFREFLFGESCIVEILLAVPVIPRGFGLGSGAARVLTPRDGTYGALMLRRRRFVRKFCQCYARRRACHDYLFILHYRKCTDAAVTDFQT
jgi:hypothetical protein